MRKIYFLVTAIFALTLSLNAQELINDGGFETDGVLVGRTANEWGAWSDNGSTVEVIDNVAVVTIGAANAAEPWHSQLEQWNAAIENDETYVIRFNAYSEAERIIQVTLEDPANGYALLGSSDDETTLNGEGRSKWDVPITTEDTQYILTTTIDGIQDNTTIKFAFLLCTTTDVVYIDNVSMMDEASYEDLETSVTVHESASMKIYPNPASSTISVKSDEAFNSVRILNIAGQESLRVNNVSRNINVESLKAGVYFVEMMNNNVTIARSQFIKK